MSSRLEGRSIRWMTCDDEEAPRSEVPPLLRHPIFAGAPGELTLSTPEDLGEISLILRNLGFDTANWGKLEDRQKAIHAMRLRADAGLDDDLVIMLAWSVRAFGGEAPTEAGRAAIRAF